MSPRFLPSAVYWTLLPERIILLRCCDCSNKVAGTPDEQIVLAPLKDARLNAQCADSEVRNAFERTPYVVVLKFHVFIHISKSFNFRCALERILRYLTKTWFYTLNFKKNPCWWLSIGYWVIENDSVSDTEECWGMHYCGAPGAWNSAIFWTDDLDPI